MNQLKSSSLHLNRIHYLSPLPLSRLSSSRFLFVNFHSYIIMEGIKSSEKWLGFLDPHGLQLFLGKEYWIRPKNKTLAQFLVKSKILKIVVKSQIFNYLLILLIILKDFTWVRQDLGSADTDTDTGIQKNQDIGMCNY